MTALATHNIAAAGPVRFVDRIADFDAIFDEEADAVICKRKVPPVVQSELERLPARAAENGRFCVPAGDVSRCTQELFQKWRWQGGQAQKWVADDVQALAGELSRILSLSHVALRIELVRDDACRKFHRDTIKARFICTYSGPGTEIGIVEEDGAPHHIENVPTGGPILLKGKLWPNRSRGSVVHRSPPIEGSGTSRLVIVLNEAPSNCL